MPETSPVNSVGAPSAAVGASPALGGASSPAELRRSACSEAAWDFSRVEEFWSRFAPLTPYGKDAKEERLVYAERAKIEALLDETELWLAYEGRQAGGGAVLDRVSYHLKRLPRLPDALAGAAEAATLELIELFQVKKFLSNYRAVAALADEPLREAFGLAFECPELAAELDRGGSDPETFFIADGYDPRLGQLRARIAALDARLSDLRRAAREEALRERGIDFGGRDFLVLPHEAARSLLAERAAFSVEPYDASSYIVRPQPSEAELALEEEREAALDAERLVEAEVLGRLSRLAFAAAPGLGRAAAAVLRLDLARARAALVKEEALSRPELGGDGLVLEGARLLPCLWDCGRLGLRYSPLDLAVGERAAVLFGSNMGGKTVALETTLFLQILAQAGFHVPAARFRTRVYGRLHFVGELRAGRGAAGAGARRSGSGGAEWGGLSGFGFEIRAFVEAWEDARRGALLVFDEFARTTSSREAEAILSAAVEALAALPASTSLFSTHFLGVARVPGVRYLRMRGLDRRAASEAMAADEPVGERIRRINSMMEYAVAEDTGAARESDAIAIAGLLGLDARIAARAAEFHDGGPVGGTAALRDSIHSSQAPRAAPGGNREKER